MKRIMLDIETLSTFPNAAVIAVALVVMEDGKPQKDWKARGWFINPELAIGHRDPATMEFWNAQPNQVKSLVFAGNDSPREALQSISAFVGSIIGDHDSKDYRVYADPSNFDFPILRYQFQQSGIVFPWYWRRERCMGSMHKMIEEEWGFKIAHVGPPEEFKHHPIHDAIAQMHELNNILECCHNVQQYFNPKEG